MTTSTPTLQQLRNSVVSLGLPAPSDTFLQSLLQPRPLAALTATAKHRLLSTNLTSVPSPLSPQNGTFPTDLNDVNIKSRVLVEDVYVQVLDIEDIGRSKWDQVEGLERERKGEYVKGREVIRVVPDSEEGGTQVGTQAPTQAQVPAQTQSHGPFKLILQDSKGLKIYALELRRVEKISLPKVGAQGSNMCIGCKMMLKRGIKIARGVVLLEPKDVLVLGGKIEGLDKAWKEGREKRLRDEVGDTERGGN